MKFLKILTLLLCSFIFSQYELYAVIDETTTGTSHTSKKFTKAQQEVKKITDLAKLLRKQGPVKYDWKVVAKILKEQAPDYYLSPKKLFLLYDHSELIGSGGRAVVFKVTLKEDRPEFQLKAGDCIAIRMTPYAPSHEYHKTKSLFYSIGFEALIRASHLKNPVKGPPLTEYFPNFYGLYYGPYMPGHEQGYCRDWVYRYEEMELVDTDFDKHFTEQNQKIPDSVIFELYYGEYIGVTFAALSIDDAKYRNYGLKKVNYERIYHLGDAIYRFPPSYMPVRLDLKGFRGYKNPNPKRFISDCLIGLNDAKTKEGKLFLSDYWEPKTDLFTLFQKHFGKYIIKDSEKISDKARHFYLEKKYIDGEAKKWVESTEKE